MSFKQFVKELNGPRVEGELVKTIVYSLITSAVVLGAIYYLFLKAEDFSKYSFWLFFSAASIALIVPTIRQVRAYKNLNCMSGMMIGMTAGMLAGFLLGFYVGATNGMFMGGVFGMVIGIALGIWMGSCCGIMGTMEGVMAGFMGGWMGAMTSVMLIADHLKLAALIVFIVNAFIAISLNYMIFVETRDSERQRKEDYFTIIAISFILTAITTWVIVFGPRGPVTI